MFYLLNNLLMRNDDDRDTVVDYINTLTTNTFVATRLAYELRDSGEIEVDNIADHSEYIAYLAKHRTEKEMRQVSSPISVIKKEREAFYTRKLKEKFPPMRNFVCGIAMTGLVSIMAHNETEAIDEIKKIRSKNSQKKRNAANALMRKP